MPPAKKPAAKAKPAATKAPAKKKPIKDPEGGLTAAGREHFKKTEGANLKPGVKGSPKTPEEMKRKGSFLRRHYANPQGDFVDENGEPTRLALQAQAWGEKPPKNAEDAAKLAAKGEKLLEKYKKLQAEEKATAAAEAKPKKPAAKSGAAKAKPAKKAAG